MYSRCVAADRNHLLRLAEATSGLPQQQRALSDVASELPVDEETRGALVRIGSFGKLPLGAFLKDPRWHVHVNRTMEQQILSLHREKRDLVDASLAGADRAGKLSAAQLAELTRGGR